jgi:hypothetical protein
MKLGSAMCTALCGINPSRSLIFGAALYHGMQVEELNDPDLSYTSPLSSPWDPIQIGAQAWSKAVREEYSNIAVRA